jgi:glycosyltransferase involved in cell wall biosynthesis
MRILVVQETDWLKRGPHQQHHLMGRMALRGHEVRVIDYEYMQKADLLRPVFRQREVHSEANKIFKDADVTLIRPRAIKGALISTLSLPYFHAVEIKRQIREFQPDVIVAFGILNAYVSVGQAKKHRIPFVYYLIDHLHTLLPQRSMRVVAKQVEKLNIRNADDVFVINKGLRDYVIDMGGKPHNISIITAGVDLERFHPSVDGSAIRRSYGITEDETLLFFMGHLYPFSGLKEVAESLRAAGTSRMKFMVVGDGGIYQELLEMSAERELCDKMIMVGKVPFEDVPQYLAAADICLLPAYRNATMENIVPIKMYEYLAMGKPIIATHLPGIVKEFGCESGISYIERAEDVVRAANELVTTGYLAEEREKARSAVESHDWNAITDEFEKGMFDSLESFSSADTGSNSPASVADKSHCDYECDEEGSIDPDI